MADKDLYLASKNGAPDLQAKRNGSTVTITNDSNQIVNATELGFIFDTL
jgi:hypothetical protein